MFNTEITQNSIRYYNNVSQAQHTSYCPRCRSRLPRRNCMFSLRSIYFSLQSYNLLNKINSIQRIFVCCCASCVKAQKNIILPSFVSDMKCLEQHQYENLKTDFSLSDYEHMPTTYKLTKLYLVVLISVCVLLRSKSLIKK